MTTLTIDLPDDIAARLYDQAKGLNITVPSLAEDFIARAVLEIDMSDYRLEPYNPTPTEIVSLDKAEADIVAGRWVSHDAAIMTARTLKARTLAERD